MMRAQFQSRPGSSTASAGIAAAVVAVFAGLLLVPNDAAAGGFDRIEQLLSSWQIDEAEQAIDRYESRMGQSAPYQYLRGRFDFYTGDYEAGLERLNRAVEEDENPAWMRLRNIVESTVETVDGYQRHESPSGNFVIYVEPGPDEVLVPFALEALEEARDHFYHELGWRPDDDEPVRVEVYPRAADLASVSELTEENIRTSGTIALCQYNRLMITSPRSMLRGYSWVDTLVHEYVHFVINRRTTERVPIWMHEGLAKYLERTWRGEGEEMLEASVEHLLMERHEEDELIAFEDMHPSMALLPSQQDAAVAFAQVYTTMEYLREQLGEGAFEKLLDTVDEGYEAREAYARVLDTDWDRFERQEWRSHIHQRELPELPEEQRDRYEEHIVFDDEAAEVDEGLDELATPEAEDHLQLGQMFQVRERYGAAAVQYKKAEAITGDKSPVLQTRLAKSLTLSGQPDEAIEALQSVKQLHPYFVYTWIELGRAYLEKGNYHAARESLREAARVNPFNPEIHELLYRAARGLGNSEEAEQARRFVDLVS